MKKQLKDFERLTPLIEDLGRSHDIIIGQKEILLSPAIPEEISSNLAFALRIIRKSVNDIKKLQEKEEKVWKESLSEYKVINIE